MRNPWVVVLFLASSLCAVAQESRSTSFNLLDDPSGVAEDQDKKQDPPVVIVTADKLQEEQPVGPYKRPEWTMHRRSPQTRIYLQVDPGEVEFEQWVEMRIFKKGGGLKEVRLSEEFEFGLGGRFQLDLYVNSILTHDTTSLVSPNIFTLAIRSWAAEVRYALADWGVIPGNPTLYLEYIMWNNGHFVDGGGNVIKGGDGDGDAASLEAKILFGGELATRWHWGVNVFYEHTMGPGVLEMGITASVVFAVVDTIFSVGMTGEVVYESDFGGAGPRVLSREAYIGPSFQLLMAPYESETEVNGVKTKVTKKRAHLDIEPVFGLTGESNLVKILLVFGWDF